MTVVRPTEADMAVKANWKKTSEKLSLNEQQQWLDTSDVLKRIESVGNILNYFGVTHTFDNLRSDDLYYLDSTE